MDQDRIVELLRPFMGAAQLRSAQIEAIQAYVALLMRWNARTNLTAVRDEENIVTRHIGESLFAARHLLADSAASVSVVDVGSGAGFPGLPLKIYAPSVDLTLIESQNKKATFLKEAIRTLHLDRVRVFGGRAESFEGRGELVTMRAVERFEATLPVAAPLVRSEGGIRGRLGLLIGEHQVVCAANLLRDFVWTSAVRIPLSTARVVVEGSRRAD